jgi:transketolase
MALQNTSRRRTRNRRKGVILRKAFVDTIIDLMQKDEKLITITADMGFSVFEEVQKLFPTRFINTGVTEQASVSVAAGMALAGYKVFFYAQAPFATMRCFEQVRLDVAYNNVDVKIVGVAAGFSSNQLGVSHFATEDVGLMRLLPGMTVFTPGDPREADWATRKAYELSTPCYIRLTKAGSPIIHKNPFSLELGKMKKVGNGNDGCLFVSGSLLPMGVEIKESLAKKNISLSLYSVPTVKPLDTKAILSQAKKTGNIFTLEEHSVVGGLGSAVAEVLSESNISTNFHRFGIPDQFTKVTGSVPYLLSHNGLSVDNITKVIKKYIRK